MALDFSLETARRAAQKVGATKPADYPGSDDQWVQDWFRQGVNAGDARLLRIADPSAKVAEGGGENDLITDWRNAAPSSEWLGKRKPTAPEVRRYYIESGKPEDFARYGDRVVSNWINTHWDVTGGHFTNDYGDVVDKPTEAGANARAAGSTVGLKSDSGGGAGGGGGAGQGGGAGRPGQGQINPQLQSALTGMYQLGGGEFGSDQNRTGVSLQNGGMIWREGTPAVAGAPPTPAATSPATHINNGAAALAAAAMNAFSPQAPSKQMGGAFRQPTGTVESAPQPAAPAMGTTGMFSGVQSPAQPTTGTSPASAPLTQALSRQYTQPNSWWMGGKRNYQY